MIGLGDIGQWRGQDVVDRAGEKLGKLTDVYIDVTTDEPTFGLVRLGFVGRHRFVLVPLHEASAGQDHVRVAYAKKLIKDAPAIEPGSGLQVEMEPRIYAHYSLDYQPAATPCGRRLARP